MDKNLHLKLGKALFERAHHDQNTKEVFDNLQMVNDVLKDPHLIDLFNNLAYAGETKIRECLTGAFDTPLEKSIFELMILLIEGYKIQLLPKIFAGYRRHRFESLGIREIKIRTARELNTEEKAKISDQLGGKQGKLFLTFQHNEKLIGGMQIVDQGRLTDLSIKNQLAHLKHHLQTTDTI